MLQLGDRYMAARPPRPAAGWDIQRLTPASRLYGANGLRAGADGRLYIAQMSGSQISALDLSNGEIEVISRTGGDIIAPDDLAFDASGNLYVTEYLEARVSVLEAGGRVRVLRDDLPGANGITFHGDRLFVDECRFGGRLVELDVAGGAPCVLLEDMPLPNALAPGPDGRLYVPLVQTGEIWRVDPDSGAHEVVVGGLALPSAVKFAPDGYLVCTQGGSGEVLRVDPRSGQSTVLAKLDPGLDNLDFVDGRLFVSTMSDGRITEVLSNGDLRAILPASFQSPLGLAVSEDGALYVADNFALYRVRGGGGLECVGWMSSRGSPGCVRGVAARGEGVFAVTMTGGRAALYRPFECSHELLAEGLDQPYGVANLENGGVLVAEFGGGRVLAINGRETTVMARDLDGPMDVEVGPDGDCFVSEARAGRVVRFGRGQAETVLEGLVRPQGIAAHNGCLYVVDAGAKTVVALELASGASEVIAADLPIGAPPGVTEVKPLRGLPPFVGPLGPFAAIAVGPDGRLFLGADGEGSVLALRRSEA